MKKSDADRQVAFDLGMSVDSVTQVTQAFLEVLEHSIASGEKVHLTGFGTFQLCSHTGAPPPGSSTDNPNRYRVSFAKASRLAKAIRDNLGEADGQVQR